MTCLILGRWRCYSSSLPAMARSLTNQYGVPGLALRRGSCPQISLQSLAMAAAVVLEAMSRHSAGVRGCW